MMTVYVAGPYRAKTRWGVVENIRKAKKVGLELCKLGCAAVVPHALYLDYDGALSDEFFLAATMRVMEGCDCVLMMDNWQDSPGAIGEYNRARKIDMPVFFSISRLENHLDKEKDLKTRIGNE
jgi:hypothetical protein